MTGGLSSSSASSEAARGAPLPYSSLTQLSDIVTVVDAAYAVIVFVIIIVIVLRLEAPR